MVVLRQMPYKIHEILIQERRTALKRAAHARSIHFHQDLLWKIALRHRFDGRAWILQSCVMRRNLVQLPQSFFCRSAVLWMKAIQNSAPLFLRIQQSPVITGKEVQDPNAMPGFIPMRKNGSCRTIHAGESTNRVQWVIPKEFPISRKTLVTTVSRQHHLAVLARGVTHREGGKHRGVCEWLIIVIDKSVE